MHTYLVLVNSVIEPSSNRPEHENQLDEHIDKHDWKQIRVLGLMWQEPYCVTEGETHVTIVIGYKFPEWRHFTIFLRG